MSIHSSLRLLAFFYSILLFDNCQSPANFTLGGEETAQIWLAPGEPAYVQLAVEDLIADVANITGKRLSVVADPSECAGHCLIIGTVTNETVAQLLPEAATEELKDQWERYAIQTLDDHPHLEKLLLIAGSNPRGTMFGIYHFLEYQLGVDPLYFWTDYEPEKRPEIVLDDLAYVSPEPDFKFRGWFINDEDLLTEWKDGGGIRTIDYPYYGQVVAPEVIQRVAEAAVRLRYNLIIPASFVDIRNPAEERLIAESSRRGLFISMHHVEPMGVSAFGYRNYWKEQGEEPLFSYYSEPEKLRQTWRLYAEKWARYPDVIWQVGLRGIADRPMWLADPGVPQSDVERARIISDAMAAQKEIIIEATGNPEPLMSTTLWAEGAVFNRQGLLDIPESVMIIFADNSPGWVWQPDFYETERIEGRSYGVYYHHQLWGSGPHLVQAVPPAKTYELFSEARETGADAYAIMNVSNVREFPLGLEASSAMLWDMASFAPEGYLQDWCAHRFPSAPEETAAAYQQFFDSYQRVGERQIPGFLDGQQRIRGRNILSELEEQLQDPVAYRAKMERRAQEKQGNTDAFRQSLSDTNPAGRLPLEEILPLVREQLSGLNKAQALAEATLSKLDGQARTLFEDNLLAQIRILSGLGQWLEACILAKQSADGGDQQAVKTNLQKAVNAFDAIRSGRQLAARGKWTDWYRGDKKMNLPALEKRTQEVLNRLEDKK
jgi:hypothetical protein